MFAAFVALSGGAQAYQAGTLRSMRSTPVQQQQPRFAMMASKQVMHQIHPGSAA
jgi:hypothetical protein